MNSAFPKWLKRLDPLLEEIERTNPIYEAFRGRREAYRWGRLPGTAPWMTAITIVLFLLGLILLPVTCCFSLLIPIAGVPLVRFHLARKLVGGTSMPTWLDGVFSYQGVRLHAAIDLWMTGTDGRTIMQGIYADRREASWLVTTAASIAAGLLILLAGGACLRNWQELVVGGLPLLYLAFVACYWIHCHAIRTVIKEQLVERLRIWEGKQHVGMRIRRGIFIIVVLWLAYCFCGWGVGTFIDVGAELDRVHGSFGVLGGQVRISWTALMGLLSLVGMAAHHMCSIWRKDLLAEAEKCFSAASPVWATYMRESLLEGVELEHRS